MTKARPTLNVLGIACVLLAGCASDSTAPAAATTTERRTTANTTPIDTTQPVTSTINTGTPQPTTGSTVSADTIAAPTTIDTARDQERAVAALLVLGDFQPGWSEVTPKETDAQVAGKRRVAGCAGAASDGGAVDFGGALAKTATFTSPDGDAVTEAVSFAPSVDVASERMTRIAKPGFAICLQTVYDQYIRNTLDGTGVTVDSVTVGKLNVTNVGDDTLAFRVTLAARNGGQTETQYTDIVVIRTGRALAAPTFQSVSSPFEIADTEAYLALAESRLPTQ